ncbi:N-6 DNA methylase [Corynebacterium hadale]|uniref:N-6 DNA methylase n=1 Tax=Corynebacterium hadale TaxID=2026255 RepID=UPI001EF22013|nr:N-6 DNA methylase [Corynebacterium hadale]MCG7254710.1 N-6 DNA methylase [Corynebacterium hadale]MCG7256992.1 N-6 DNA methylase [Corynebacterium hadale]MCG7265550.1 N-6 DNA methylase [Corynebacterium hadale]
MVATTGHLTLKDIAELAQVGRPAVSNWRKRYDDFPAPVEESTPRKPLFEAASVIEWLKRNDFFPEDAEQELQVTALWAVANLLRGAIPVENYPLVLLTLLALDKDPAFQPSDEFEKLRSRISAKTIEDVENGIANLDLKDYDKAAQLIVDRFLGIGSRGARSQYGTSRSLSSAALAAAASTTTKNVKTVLDPACGIGGTLLSAGKHAPTAQLAGVEIDPYSASLARLLVHLTEQKASIKTGDSLRYDPFSDVQADLIVCEPTIGMRFAGEELDHLQRVFPNYPLRGLMSDDLFLLYCVQHLATDGRAYVITGLGTTFNDRFKEHRQRLTAKGQIETVVQLPGGILSASRIPVALWVLSTGGVREPLLIDASGQEPESVPQRIADWLTAARNKQDTDVLYKAVSLADVVTNDGSLHPSTYLVQPTDPNDAAAEFDAAFQRLQTTTKDFMNISAPRVSADTIPPSTTSTTMGELVNAGHFIRIAGSHRYDESQSTGSARLATPNDNVAPAFVNDFDPEDLLQPGDILMPRLGTAPARVHEDDGQNWVPSRHFIVFRAASDAYDPYFIAACLNAPMNSDSRGRVPRRNPVARLVIPELNRDQQAVIAETQRSLDSARSAAHQLERETKHASEALINLVFAGK